MKVINKVTFGWEQLKPIIQRYVKDSPETKNLTVQSCHVEIMADKTVRFIVICDPPIEESTLFSANTYIDIDYDELVEYLKDSVIKTFKSFDVNICYLDIEHNGKVDGISQTGFKITVKYNVGP